MAKESAADKSITQFSSDEQDLFDMISAVALVGLITAGGWYGALAGPRSNAAADQLVGDARLIARSMVIAKREGGQ